MKKGFLTCVLFVLLAAAGGITTMAGGVNPATSPSIAPIPPWLHYSSAAARSRDARMIPVPVEDPDAMAAATSTKTLSDRTPGTPGLVFGRVGGWGSDPYYDVALMSHYAVCASFDGSMDVLDIADPADLQRVASLDLGPGGGPFIVRIAGQLAYVANFNYGLQIVDLSRPEIPRLLSAYDPGGTNDFRGLIIKGSYVYLIQGPQLHVVDVSDPGHPVAAATYTDTSTGQALAISGTYVYGLFGNHLRILDISTPTDPQAVGMLELPTGTGIGVAVKDDFVYVTGPDLAVVDVSQPNQPVVVTQIENVFGQYPTIRDNHLYVPVFDSSRGVLDFDISNPQVPKRVGVVNHLGVMRITAPGSYLYLAGTDGLTIMDPTAITNQPFQLGHTPLNFQLREMERSDSILLLEHYTTMPDMALSILDMTDPAAPEVLKSLPGVTSFARQGTTLYTATGGIPSTSPSRLDVSSITNPTNPVTIGTLELSGYIAGLAARDGMVVGGFTRPDNGSESGLYIIDTTSASHPILAGTLFFDQHDIMVASTLLTADRAFVLTDEYVSDPDSSGLEIFGSLNVVDISDPTHPTLTYRIDGLGGCRGLFLNGNILYAGTDTRGLLVLDVSDPDQPIELLSPPNLPFLPVSFAKEGDTLVAGGLGGLLTLDVSDPSRPVFLERISSGADDVFAISLNNNILTAMTSYTLDVLDLDQLHDATSIMGAFHQSGPDTGFDTAGHTLFLGRRILDVSDPAAPTVVGTLPMIGDRIDTILARGDRVYAAQDVFPIVRTTAIVDVADPAQPRLLGTLPFSSILSQMMDANERTVVDAPERNMFRLWDITDPARPVLASTTTMEPVDNAWIGPMGPSVRLIDDRLYIASDNLFTYDVSDATRPVLVSTLMTPGFSRLMAVDGDRIFSVADYHWFQVIDISDPTAPEIIGNLQLPGTVHDLLVSGGYVVVAIGTDLLAVDVSDPTQPILVDAPSNAHLQGLTRLALASGGIVAGDNTSGKVDIYHLGNAPGINALTATPTAGVAPLTVRFSATTADADGTVTEFRWDFDGDGVIDEVTSTGEIAHTYTTTGMYHPLLQVADDQSLVTSAPSLSVRVDDPEQAYTVYISGSSPEFPSYWLVNPGEDPAAYTLNGFTDTIPAGGKVALSSATTGGTITSARRILVADEWTSPGRNMAAWFSSPASSQLVAPHVAVDLANWDTLAFLNPVADNGFILSMADRSLSWNDYYPSLDLGTMAEGLDDSVAWALFKTRPRNPFTDPGKTSGIETFTLRNGDGAAVELVGSGSEKLFIPHLPAPDSGYWAGIGLVNLEERTIRATFSFYGADGSPQGTEATVSIPPRTKLSSLIRELIPELPAGAVWGCIEADGRLAGAEVFGSETAGLAGLSLAGDALTTGILPLVHIDSDRLTGVAFTNPSGVDARIVVSLVAADGTVKDQQEITVGPMSQVARLAGQLFEGIAADETDTIRFSANVGVIATEVLVDPVSFTMCGLSAAM